MTEEVEGLGEKKKEEFNSIFNEIRKRINEEKEVRLSRPIRFNLTHLENLISPIGREFSEIIHEEEPVERKFVNESIQDLLLKVQQESNDALEDNLEMRGDIRELETELDILQKENKELRALADEGGWNPPGNDGCSRSMYLTSGNGAAIFGWAGTTTCPECSLSTSDSATG